VGEQEPVFWIMQSLAYIDYSREAFVKESMLVMHYSKGGLTVGDLERMPFNIFEMYVDEAIRIQNEQTKNNEGDIKHG
jgi:hypothetical protein